jgi:integrase/recombinase XerD
MPEDIEQLEIAPADTTGPIEISHEPQLPDLLRPALLASTIPPPAIIADAGPNARFAWEEFFQGEIANAHTRKNYNHAVRKFLTWAETRNVALLDITPGMVGTYFQELTVAIPTKKLHLAALRKFFDRLVNRHAVYINPAATVRTERYSISEGKTPEIPRKQAEVLIMSIETTYVDKSEIKPDLVGLRDLAILAVLPYTAARVSAVAKLTFRSLRHDGTQYALRFLEKGGKSRDIPVRSDLQKIVLAYVQAAGITDGPLFRSAAGKTGNLTANAMTGIDICRMMKRRLKAAGLPDEFSPHSFRVTTVTDLLEQNTALEDVQYLAGHADPRTTRLYDRRRRKVTRNIVERISINIGKE